MKLLAIRFIVLMIVTSFGGASSFAVNPLEEKYIEKKSILEAAYAKAGTPQYTLKQFKTEHIKPWVDQYSWAIPNDLAWRLLKNMVPS